MLKNVGVIIEDEESNRKAVTPEEAEKIFENMSAKRKKLYMK